MDLTEKQSEQFISGIANVYSHDDTFMTRFNYTLPLFGMRWALILLNEFVPEFWQNRQHADVHASHAEAKLNQLNLAKALLQNVIQIGCKHENIAATSI